MENSTNQTPVVETTPKKVVKKSSNKKKVEKKKSTEKKSTQYEVESKSFTKPSDLKKFEKLLNEKKIKLNDVVRIYKQKRTFSDKKSFTVLYVTLKNGKKKYIYTK